MTAIVFWSHGTVNNWARIAVGLTLFTVSFVTQLWKIRNASWVSDGCEILYLLYSRKLVLRSYIRENFAMPAYQWVSWIVYGRGPSRFLIIPTLIKLQSLLTTVVSRFSMSSLIRFILLLWFTLQIYRRVSWLRIAILLNSSFKEPFHVVQKWKWVDRKRS